MQIHPEHSPPTFAMTRAPSSSAANASITGVSPNLFWANTLIAGIAIAISVWCVVQLQRSERETRMLEYYVLEMDAKLIAAGVKKPEDAVAKKLER